MRSVDYEQIAASFDRRYAVNDVAGVARCLSAFLGTAASIAELGCGTGHWLALARTLPQCPLVVGLDLAFAMLSRARENAPDAPCVRGTADRVLQPGGAFLTIGLDPHTGADQWWIYDYFPGALEADRQRYPSTDAIRADLTAAGFRQVDTVAAQHTAARLTFADAEARGFLDRRSTSQLLVIDDAEWTAGIAHLRRDRPTLTADLRLYATIARLA